MNTNRHEYETAGRVDIPERFAYGMASAAALELYLLPVRHAERPGRGYFPPDMEVTHAN